MSDEIMSAERAAEVLSLSPSAMYKLLQQGEIPGAKIGGQWRVRHSDLERAFDLARARATAQQRERTATEVWGPAMQLLEKKHPKESFVLTRCLWCPEFVPTWTGARYTTLCSSECARELCGAFQLLGWRVTSDYTLSPIYRMEIGDGTELMLGPWNFEAEQHGAVPDHELMSILYAQRHERGPLRELLLLENPLMRAHALVRATSGGQASVSGSASGPKSASRSGSGAGQANGRGASDSSAVDIADTSIVGEGGDASEHP